jgi:hypothetical protein
VEPEVQNLKARSTSLVNRIRDVAPWPASVSFPHMGIVEQLSAGARPSFRPVYCSASMR